ncbi:BRCT domain-containing protein [Pseudomonas aeruginosa]|uniref:BRCT domain-containing protein n=1 Tax=Pseudomonas aeruginosa TaxID=287 RepID=UPI0032E42BAC
MRTCVAALRLPVRMSVERVSGCSWAECPNGVESAPPTPEPAPKAMPDMRPQILFTGFKSADKDRLESVATEHGFRVMKTVGKSLSILCIGGNAGPTKVESAQGYGAFILTEEQFSHLVKTGEVPC